MENINIKDLRTYQRFAEENTTAESPLSRSRVIQLIRDKRLERIEIDGKFFIHKDAVILPSKAVINRKKKMGAFIKSFGKQK